MTGAEAARELADKILALCEPYSTHYNRLVIDALILALIDAEKAALAEQKT